MQPPSLSNEALQAAAAVCRLAANTGVCISSYSPLGHGFVCTPDSVWFTKEERSIFMSLNNLTMDKGVKKICQFLFVCVICVYIYLSICLFIYFTLTAVVS